MQLVPDIEFRMAHRQNQGTTLTTMDFRQTSSVFFWSNSIELRFSSSSSIRDEIDESIGHVETSEDKTNLLDSFQNLQLDENSQSKICQKNFPQQVRRNGFSTLKFFFCFQTTHISALPSEVLIDIFRWVVSSDLDVRSLEQCARVCRGFYVCARDPQLWKMVCRKIWGLQTGNPHAHVNWRHMFINRPHILFNGNVKRFVDRNQIEIQFSSRRLYQSSELRSSRWTIVGFILFTVAFGWILSLSSIFSRW